MQQLNEYKHGKIYVIICLFTGEIYVGSTKEEFLKERIKAHTALRHTYLQWVADGKPGGKVSNISSFSLIARGMWTYFCLEDYPCNSKKELQLREGYHIRLCKEKYGALCVNKVIPGRTPTEWAKNNPESIKRSNQKQYTKNAVKYREDKKVYRKEKPEKSKACVKRCYEKNGAKYAARSKEKIECQFCGLHVSRKHIRRHERSQMCQNSRTK
jgi:hypothetical protein